MRRIASAFLLIFLSISATNAESLIWPLDCVPQLTSSFGEFRVGRFHAGIDFRTPAGEGMPIIAIGDGSVVRIRCSPWGYGKVIYYRMAGDRIAVFAHLSGFHETIEQRLFDYKMKERKNFAELWFKEGELAFRAGDTLGFSGSTGAGSAHLHFELRDGWDRPFDPAIVGFITSDVLPPTITAIWAVPFGNNAAVNGRYKPARLLPQSGRPIRFEASGDFYLAIEAFDLESTTNPNRYGIGNISLHHDGETIYQFHADTLSFSQNRQAGLIFDLGVQEEFGLRRPPFRLKHPFGADIGLLKGTFEGAGVIQIEDEPLELRLVLVDSRGNSTEQAIIVEPAQRLPNIGLTAETAENAIEFVSDITAEDTIGLRFEFSIGGDMLRDRMPFDGSPTSVSGDAVFARIRPTNGANPIALWRQNSASAELSTQIFGADNIIVMAKYDAPPSALPRLKFREGLLFPEMEDSITFAFRLFGYEAGKSLTLVGREGEIEFTPDVFVVRDGARIDLFDGLCRLTIPDGGTFFPFLARAERIPADSLMSERYSIQPAGAMLRSRAEISFAMGLFDRQNDFNCLIQIWRGDTIFTSNNFDRHNNLKGNIGAFGVFGFAVDTLAPTLEFDFREGANITRLATATIRDDLSGFSNDVLPDCYIDGEWTPCEYDPDSRKLLVNVERFERGERTLRIVARDIVGNVIEKETKFNKN
ncbi:MAG TPA: M23 family metallopeptidase [candidate division Zixibacteria bacterium]|nr:M23 family metallopeptidase [candidate division Zixibacteria bacterium]